MQGMTGETTLLSQAGHTNAYHPAPRSRSVAVVSHNPDQHVVNAVLGAVDHEIVLMEPTVHAYSHIKHLRPDLVIICMSSNDAEGCQVLSMLTLDRETARIPVVAYVAPVDEANEEALPASLLN